MAKRKTPTPLQPAPRHPSAGLLRRLGALLYDYLVVIALLRREVVALVAGPALVAAAVLVAAGLWLLARGAEPGEPAEPLRNPFELRALLIFAGRFALVSTASAAVVTQFGGSGLAASAALSGTLDVDVAVLSALRVTNPAVSVAVIATAILGALAANAFGRCSLAALAGPARFWMPLAAWTLAALAAGIAAYALLPTP